MSDLELVCAQGVGTTRHTVDPSGPPGDRGGVSPVLLQRAISPGAEEIGGVEKRLRNPALGVADQDGHPT